MVDRPLDKVIPYAFIPNFQKKFLPLHNNYGLSVVRRRIELKLPIRIFSFMKQLQSSFIPIQFYRNGTATISECEVSFQYKKRML